MAYVHESNQRLHFIPSVPVQLSDQLVMKNRDVFVRLHREHVASQDKLADDARNVIADHPYLFEQTAEEVSLSPFGAFLAARALRRRVLVSKSVRAIVERGDTRALAVAEIKDLMARLDDPHRHRSALHHEADWGIRDAKVCLFKGASGKAGVFRAAYWLDELDDLHLEQVWTDHDDYEREAESSLRRGRGATSEDVSDSVHKT
jgi:hemolysin-activating ACP:hemolysin acyltransferase